MEGSLLLGRLGIQESFGLEGLVEVNSGLLEAKNWGHSSSVEVSILNCGLGEGEGVRSIIILPLCLSEHGDVAFCLLE